MRSWSPSCRRSSSSALAGPSVSAAKAPPGPAGVHVRPSARSNPAGATPPGTRTRGPTASTRSCRRTGRPGPSATSATPTPSRPPANQEKVAAGQVHVPVQVARQLARVAYWWLTGSKRTTGWSSYATRYVNRVMRLYKKAGGVDQRRRRPLEPAAKRYSESSKLDRLQRVVEDRQALAATPVTRSATRPGPARRATFTFTGQRDRPVRPARPDPRQGQGLPRRHVRQDGQPAPRLVRRPGQGLPARLEDRPARTR